MKTIILLALLSFSASTFHFYNGLDAATDPEQRLRAKIAFYIGVPDMYLKKDVPVKIKFEINDEKRLNVLSVDPDDDKIVKYIKSKLNDKKIKLPLNKKSFTVGLVFKKTEDF
ncbi:hypothetical protein MHTCC0001_24070 [Flavobacteriaceae bacterium MHTCC 0001]